MGKDYLDLYRPLTHTKVQFGESRYWVEHNKQEIPYGTILTAILNYDAQPYLEAVQRLKDAVAAQNDGEVLTALEEVRNMFLQLPSTLNQTLSLGLKPKIKMVMMQQSLESLTQPKNISIVRKKKCLRMNQVHTISNKP